MTVAATGRWRGRLALAVLVLIGSIGALADRGCAQSGRGRSAMNLHRDAQGNRIPDFSSCGYAGADRDIPDVAVRVTVAPGAGDDGSRIQAAIDQVAALPRGADGFRGAVLLAPGEFDVAGQLRLAASGVVLRGSGALDGGSTITATGVDRRALIRIVGANDRQTDRGAAARVVDDYVPVGAFTLRLSSAASFAVGDAVIVTRPSTREWVREIGCDAFGVGWRPGSRDLRWDRRITAIDGDAVTLDAPITTALEARFGGGTVAKYAWPGRIENVGVENLRLVSAHDAANPHDEQHSWFGVTMDNVRDAWVRCVPFRGFAGGAVAAWETASRATVVDCTATEPVSEVAGYRRQSFFIQGQQILLLRCWSDEGRRDFAVGHCAPGPNAFVNCIANRTHGDSGPVESWAAGVLYDNVRIDGGALVLDNRWTAPVGCGWSAANCVLWQCQAATMRVFRPPTANNWAIGVWAMFAGDGVIEGQSDFASPLSLYQAQLRERVGDAAAERVGPFLLHPESSTNPTLEQARGFVARSNGPAAELVEVIEARMRSAAASHSASPAPSHSAERAGERGATGVDAASFGGNASTTGSASTQGVTSPPTPLRRGEGSGNSLRVNNGWLVIGNRLVTGSVVDPKWWAGNNRPDEAPGFGPSITRFVPGHVGVGLTDDLAETADAMQARGAVAYDHHYGLWYDLRRADHLHVRQADANCGVPFYEQPFARTGRGRAWDGLSKYDLTKFNVWYWGRLADFARLCDERGLVLIHENYFQHNILEAGAHWVDCPWRPVNNVNDTGFAEPPPFIGDKRIFLAHQFYDLTNHRRRELHRGYIRQCLDGLAASKNVIQMTCAEFSGPLEFTQFWVDTVGQWEREKGRDVIVALSAPKNVQDAILADPERAPVIDVVDIRYWCYTAGGGTYAPDGGQNLAPRQHLRQTKEKPGGFGEIARAVREYREQFPDKAVTYYAEQNCPSRHDGWAVLMGGGSLADVRLPPELAALVPTLKPITPRGAEGAPWCLGREGEAYLYYLDNRGATTTLADVPAGKFRVRWVNPRSGEATDDGEIEADDGGLKVAPKSNIAWVTRAN
jgi:hypothetical protein